MENRSGLGQKSTVTLEGVPGLLASSHLHCPPLLTPRFLPVPPPSPLLLIYSFGASDQQYVTIFQIITIFG